MRVGGQTLGRRRANVWGDRWQLCCRGAEGKRIGPMTEKRRRDEPQSGLPNGGPASKVNRALKSIVTVQSQIPEDAFTAQTLGEQRSGSGVVIRESGLVLTIGYLITEAEHVWLADAEGRVTPAHALAIDAETGFGLVQALGELNCPALELGRSSEAKLGDPVTVAAGAGTKPVRAMIVGKQEFAGYWEYFLEEAIFTSPAHPFWGGAGAIDHDGRLIGVGSLHVEQLSERTGPRARGLAFFRPKAAMRLSSRASRNGGRPPKRESAAATFSPASAGRRSKTSAISITRSGAVAPPGSTFRSKSFAMAARWACACGRLTARPS